VHIVSKFHDYYDTALGVTGVDKSIIYVRETRDDVNYAEDKKLYNHIRPFARGQIPAPWWFRILVWNRDAPKDWLRYNRMLISDVYPIIVSVAARTYHGLRLEVWPADQRDRGYTGQTLYVWNPDEVNLIVDMVINSYTYKSEVRRRRWEAFLAYQVPESKHHKNNSPVLAFYRPEGYDQAFHWLVNPCLREFDFMKALDPFTCLQEIQMYVSGVLRGTENATVEISDKHKVAAHGHDPDYGFRTRPGTKKPRRKK
jgi:hypothetical protein